MKACFIFLLLFVSLSANAQSYTRCLQYEGDEHTPHDLAHLLRIENCNARHKVISAKHLCRERKSNDTSCVVAVEFNTYNEQGLISDSLYVKLPDDTTHNVYTYNNKNQLVSMETVITLHRKTTGKPDSLQTLISNTTYMYNTTGNLLTSLEKKVSGKNFAMDQHRYEYDKQGRMITDSSFAAMEYHRENGKTDSSKWFSPVWETYTYTKDGYDFKFYNSNGHTDGPESETKFIYEKDKKGRIVSELSTSLDGRMASVIYYGYFPDKRITKIVNRMPWDNGLTSYIYVYK